MLEIKPITITPPVLKTAKIKKNDPHPNHQQPKKKPVLEEQVLPENIQHIDEIV